MANNKFQGSLFAEIAELKDSDEISEDEAENGGTAADTGDTAQDAAQEGKKASSPSGEKEKDGDQQLSSTTTPRSISKQRGEGAQPGTQPKAARKAVKMDFSKVLKRYTLDFDKLASNFTQEAVIKEETKKDSKKAKKEETTLLDKGKAQNVEITLNSRKLTVEVVTRRVEDLEESAMSFDALQAVIGLYPNAEDAATLNAFTPSPDLPPLAKAESFLIVGIRLGR